MQRCELLEQPNTFLFLFFFCKVQSNLYNIPSLCGSSKTCGGHNFLTKARNEKRSFVKVSSDHKETFTKDRFSFRALVKKLWPLQILEFSRQRGML
jgi:hypothetical protein